MPPLTPIVPVLLLLSLAGTCSGPAPVENIGGPWFIEYVAAPPKAGLTPRNLVREVDGRRVRVDSLIEYWQFHAPDCVVYQTAREQHQVRTVCGDRTPVAISTSSVVQWDFAADGLRRTGTPYLANGRAVARVEFVPMAEMTELAMRQPPLREGWERALSPPSLRPVQEERPVDPNVRRADGNTPLIDAVVRGHLEIVEALLAAGADPDGRSGSNGSTALMAASGIGGSIPIVDRLLAAKADVNLQDQRGETALMRAAGVGNTEIARRLLAAGADRALRDANGRTAYDRVADSPNAELRALLKP
jgi:hypothetical protein